MTTQELVEKLIAYAGDDYDESQLSYIESLIGSATAEVVHALYKGPTTDTQFAKLTEMALNRYAYNILAISQYHYDKRGVEGVLSYKENTTQHTYEEGGHTPQGYFRGIIPIARII